MSSSASKTDLMNAGASAAKATLESAGKMPDIASTSWWIGYMTIQIGCCTALIGHAQAQFVVSSLAETLRRHQSHTETGARVQ